MGEAQLVVRITKELRNEIKALAASKGESLKTFVTRAIQKEIEKTKK